jgi:hypothetical protein
VNLLIITTLMLLLTATLMISTFVWISHYCHGRSRCSNYIIKVSTIARCVTRLWATRRRRWRSWFECLLRQRWLRCRARPWRGLDRWFGCTLRESRFGCRSWPWGRLFRWGTTCWERAWYGSWARPWSWFTCWALRGRGRWLRRWAAARR